MKILMKSLGMLAALAVLVAAAAAAERHGSLAYRADTGAFGYSHDFNNPRDADRRALQECGRGCSIVVRFKNGCGAYASAPNGAYGWGVGPTRDAAEYTAFDECDSRAPGCEIRVWGCNTR
ncbi:DUF4189 domain-containing protein [Breoghania sp. L-A4]|uniref:DUF4189 domain-containing protein n=1 Tax=Breoghania sp. L-A4 TaxID=2304600 RepID=UPI000E358EFE|nr:DUF4189 domain-containing protein [Breoghania sp. L-A4]AXS39093.1 DUF4189 domain-containing protein [Breoghania sp. L-A4]